MKDEKRIYTVFGVTGNIGKPLAKLLLEKKYIVRAVGRDPKKLSELKKMGAEIYSAGWNHVKEMTEIMEGSTGIMTIFPPSYTADNYDKVQEELGAMYVEAIQKSKVKYVVNISSIGADLEKNAGVLNTLHRNEERLNKIPNVNLVQLRPPFFMQNLYWVMHEIEANGTFTWPLKADVPYSYVSTDDIGGKVFDLLEKLKFKNKSNIELFAPQQWTHNQVAEVIGKALGREVRYVKCSYEEALNGMVGSGFMKESAARGVIGLYRAYNENLIKYHQKPTKEWTCETTLKDFVSRLFRKKNNVA